MTYIPDVSYAFIKWTVLASPVATISITNIPVNYNNLMITGAFRTSHTATDLIGIRFNSDSNAANYNSYLVAIAGTYGNAIPTEYLGTNGFIVGGFINGNNAVSSYRAYMNIILSDYNSTTYSKNVKTDWGAPVANTTNSYPQGFNLGVWGNPTTAVTSIDLVSFNGANFMSGTAYQVRVF